MKNKNRISFWLVLTLCFGLILSGCGNQAAVVEDAAGEESIAESQQEAEETVAEEAQDSEEEDVANEQAENVADNATIALDDGVYLADFNTDSTMFHVNETCDGKGILTVKDGQASIHIVLVSKNIINLYEGLAEDAEKDGAVLLQPTVEAVTYEDGLEEEVNAFDVSVPYLDQEFDLALIGTKGVWYDHKVSVSNPESYTEDGEAEAESDEVYATENETVLLTLEGGSGKATVESPAVIKDIDGMKYVVIVWSSPNYDYMLLDGIKYLPVNEEGNSTFELPISDTDGVLNVIADTVAMSKPHEIEYTLTLKSNN